MKAPHNQHGESSQDEEKRLIVQGLEEALGLNEKPLAFNTQGLFDRQLFRKALESVPELSHILIRAARGEITREEARLESAPHLEALKKRYSELIKAC